jgi:hypothetical protein
MSNPELDHLDVDQQAPAEAPTAAIKLNVNEINIVLAALQELPHKVSDGLLRNIVAQANEQLQGK